MKKIINHYQFVDCTAIAASEGDTERQSAVLIRDLDAAVGDADSILFGWSVTNLPDSESELEYTLYGEPISMDDEDLKTVEVDERPLSDYVGGAL